MLNYTYGRMGFVTQGQDGRGGSHVRWCVAILSLVLSFPQVMVIGISPSADTEFRFRIDDMMMIINIHHEIRYQNTVDDISIGVICDPLRSPIFASIDQRC